MDSLKRKIDQSNQILNDSLRTKIPKLNHSNGEGEGEPAALHFDREAFLQRLKTYEMSMFFTKTKFINPVDCARYGWKNLKLDVLSCSNCDATLTVSIFDNLSESSVKVVVSKIYEELINSHQQFCPWKSGPLPENTLESLVLKESFLENFKRDMNELRPYGTKLPLPKQDPILEQKTSALKTWYFVEPKDETISEIMEKALVSYCVYNWHPIQMGRDKQLLGCKYCFRNVGFWNFQPILTPDETMDDAQTDPTSQINITPAPPAPVLMGIHLHHHHTNNTDVDPLLSAAKLVSNSLQSLVGMTQRRLLGNSAGPKKEFNLAEEHRWFCPFQNENLVQERIQQLTVKIPNKIARDSVQSPPKKDLNALLANQEKCRNMLNQGIAPKNDNFME